MHREVNHHFADLGPNDDIENAETVIREMEGLGVKHKVEEIKIWREKREKALLTNWFIDDKTDWLILFNIVNRLF